MSSEYESPSSDSPPPLPEVTATPPVSRPPNPDSLSRRKVGALWTRTSKSGNKYLSGVLDIGSDRINVNVIRNDRKVLPRHPDYEVFVCRDDAAPKEIPL